MTDTASAAAAAADRLARLLEANRSAPDAGREREIIDLRRAAYEESHWPPPAPAAVDEAPALTADTLPEISPGELSSEWLRDGILGAGGLIVRGLLPDEAVRETRAAIDRAFESRRAQAADPEVPEDRWYARASTVKGAPQQFSGALGAGERATGSLWAVDSPATAFDLCELYHALGLPELLASYLGERAVLSVKKWVLRKVEPNPGLQADWHQDGRFLGEDIRTVNLWIALSDCGEGADAPGMELVGGREPRIHPTGTDGAVFDWTVGPGIVERLAQERPRLYPRFRAGDALFFDHFNLHRTGSAPSDTAIRYAVESWFFGASTAPERQQPLVL